MMYQQVAYPPPGYGGGYTYSPYMTNYAQPMYAPPPGQMMMIPPPPPIRQMPVSQQTNVININMWNNESTSLQVAQQLGLLEEEEIEAEEEEEEEVQDEIVDEEEVEEAKEVRKKIQKKAKKKARVNQKLNEKAEEDPSIFDQYKEMYAEELIRRFERFGTLEPTEGTVKPLTTYPPDDPVFLYTQENEGFDLEEWDAEYDCVYLKNAMDGAGTNEQAIIDVIAHRSNAQRHKLLVQYKTNSGEDLIERLNEELSGDLKETVMALFEEPAKYDAWCIKEAIYGPGTDESVLVEILTSRKNEQIHAIRDAYVDVASPNRVESESLIEEDIENDTSGDFKKFLISAVQGNRSTLDPEKIQEAVEFPVDEETGNPKFPCVLNESKLAHDDRAKREAEKLYEASEDSIGTDEEEFVRIFANREKYQLMRTYDHYVKLTQRDILNTIGRETSGNFELCLRSLVMNIRCPPMYFAAKLEECMKGLGTEDSDLIRLIVTRCEIDMVQIKEAFLQKTNKTLYKWLEEDCSGDYKNLLCALVGKN